MIAYYKELLADEKKIGRGPRRIVERRSLRMNDGRRLSMMMTGAFR